MVEFVTKDSGQREEYASGMRRDTQEGKPRFDLVYQPMLKRLADLYSRGAVKYSDWNWQKADSKDELVRFKASAYRHFYQWFNGIDTEEDHAAAVMWNIISAEYLKDKLGTDINGEVWETISEAPTYEVSTSGKVRRNDGKLMSQWTNCWGYKMVSLSGGSRKHYQVHRLVMQAFIGTPSVEHVQVNHKDGIKSNNDLFNLEYVTVSENIQHAFDTGLMKAGKNNAKIDFNIAQEIRLRVDAGEKQNVLAKEFNISTQTVNDIVKYRVWKDGE